MPPIANSVATSRPAPGHTFRVRAQGQTRVIQVEAPASVGAPPNEKAETRKRRRVRSQRQIDVNVPEVHELLKAALVSPMSPEAYTKVKTAVDILVELVQPPFRTSEKKDALLDSSEPKKEEKAARKRPRRGHGRHAAADYMGARRIVVRHEDLKPGCPCPECPNGRLYPKRGTVVVRLFARAPIDANVYEIDESRCNLCGLIVTADPPKDMGDEKHDVTVGSMLALLKYGSGFPFNRIEILQHRVGIPMPASTQYEILQKTAKALEPVHEALKTEAAQRDLLHADDTSMRVLKIERPAGDKRTGVHTTGIVAKGGAEPPIALYFTGRKHAGENVAEVLERRATATTPTLMVDALACNAPKSSSTKEPIEHLLANCLAHGRRHFVDLIESSPAECRHVVETIGKVYANDAEAKEQGLSAEERLQSHQTRSGPLMNELREWMITRLAEQKTEPNSRLGRAMKYLLNHWEALTLFLRQAGAPLDNNIAERMLKKAVLHRKNALFYRTQKGASQGDLYMSIIHTCELNGVNAFEYMNEAQRHSADVAANPKAWMPWSYTVTLAARTQPPDSG